MAVVFNLLATQVPPPVVPGAFYPPRISTPLNSPYIPSGSTPDVLLPLAKETANRLDMTARYGSPGGYGVLDGLGLLDYTTSGIPVTAGVASLDGLAFLLALPGTDARVTPGNPSNIGGFAVVSNGTAINNYLYVTSAQGVIAFVKQVGSLTPPAGAVAYLGRVQMNSGVGTIDGSGVFTRRFGGGWERQTADSGKPTDTPPAGIRFYNMSLGDGTVWYWTGTQYVQFPSAYDPTRIVANAQSANYTLVGSDAGKVIEMTSASALTLTVPTNASVPFATGAVIEVWQGGAGQITIAGAGGVTLRSNGAKVHTAAQYSTASLRKQASDTWVLSGDLI